MDINILGIFTVLITAINILLAVAVILRKTKNKLNNYAYVFVLFSISSWTLATYFYNNPVYFAPAEWLKIIYLLSYLMLISKGLFVFLFPRRIPGRYWFYFGIVLLSIIPSAYALLITNEVVVSATHYADHFMSVAVMGDLYWVYTIPNVLAIFFLSIYFWRKTKWFTGFEQAQIRIYILGSLAMFVPIIVIDYLVPFIWGYTNLYALGPLFVVFYTVSVSYSILRNRFFELHSILEKALEFILSYVVTAFILTSIILLIESILELDQTSAIFFVLFIVSPILAVIVERLQKRIKKLTRQTLEHQTVNKDKILADLNKSISKELDLELIDEHTREALQQYFTEIKSAQLFLMDKSLENTVFSTYETNLQKDIEILLKVVSNLDDMRDETILIYDDIKRRLEDEQAIEFSSLLDFMNRHKIEVMLYLNQNSRAIGFLFLEKGHALQNYTVEDIQFLETIILNLNLAIERALLYEESQNFNQILSQKVDKATAEIKQQKDQLEETLRKERDMMDILAHELRTPLSIANNSLKMLMMKVRKLEAENKILVSEVKPKLEVMNTHLEREKEILESVLYSTKIESGELKLSKERINVNEIIGEVVKLMLENANERNIDIIANTIRGDVCFMADKKQVKEILSHLVSNAIKYSLPFGIQRAEETKTVRIEVEELENDVRVSVIDEGIGIPEGEMENLGKKFHRVGMYTNDSAQYKSVRPGGVGIGLYVTKGLLKLMGGELTVQSKLDEGSTFSFILPKCNQKETIHTTLG